jgi:hypothetical protein
MAETRRSELSSLFDDMLTQSRKQFDDLYRGGLRRSGERVADARPPAAADRDSSSRTAKASTALDASSSPAMRRMNERFGSDWRYEITEQRRESGEAIVLCKLTFGKDGGVRTQFGRATFSSGAVSGAVDGVRFSLGASGSAADERDAFRRAAEAALMNCIALI